MKLLLTSAGITNKKIAKALTDLVGKPAKKITVAFIPTAANVEDGDKGWFIDYLCQLRAAYKSVDIVDISALPKKIWLPRLEAADVLLFSGGNTTHLMHWLIESGLQKILPKLLTKKVYVGISAGSIVTSPTFSLSDPKRKQDYKKKFGYTIDKALGIVNFYMRPHLNSPKFPDAKFGKIKERAFRVKEPVYALDDQMAIKVNGKKIEVVGEGKYFVFNTK
jgi:dipeptidase E